jgi:hypothetical protein
MALPFSMKLQLSAAPSSVLVTRQLCFDRSASTLGLPARLK